MGIQEDRNLAGRIQERLPQFVQVDHPTLVAFLSAYYEWLDLRRNSGLIMSPMELGDVSDIDRTMDQFVEQFKKEYLFQFPDTLAVSKQTGLPVDTPLLLKNIKQFYKAKGTEKSYEFLFRIFYDTTVEFYYPKTDILRLSSGRWVQNNYLRVSNSLGDDIYKAAGNVVVQRDARGRVLATAKVIDVSVYQKGNFTVGELLITARNGTFRTGTLGFEFTDGSAKYKEVKIYSVVSSITISNGGSDYKVGDRVVFTPVVGDSGQRATAAVSEVTSTGEIRTIKIEDFGINYEVAPSITIDSQTGSGFSGSVTVGSICSSAGFYANSDGKLSSDKVLQDNHYYQNWSYVLKSEVVIDRYRELIRKLVHPVGTAMFGTVQVKRCLREDIDNATAIATYEIPFIGNYVPYTFYTFDNLEDWFVSGGVTAGYNPLVHDDLIRGISLGKYNRGNPISNRVGFAAASDVLVDPDITGMTGPAYTDPPSGDSFWFVYRHPNRKLYGDHLIKVWSDQVEDFITWQEWLLPRVNGNEQIVASWIDEARQLEKNPASCCVGQDGAVFPNQGGSSMRVHWRTHDSYKYALVSYDTSSDFRKIRTGSFFNMPRGEEFDCRSENLARPTLPSVRVDSPLEGQVITVSPDPQARREDWQFYRLLDINYLVNFIQNAEFYKADAVKFTLDGKTQMFASLGGTDTVQYNQVSDGRHTLVVELVDKYRRTIPGTRLQRNFFFQFLAIENLPTVSEGDFGNAGFESDPRPPVKTVQEIDFGANRPINIIDPDKPEAPTTAVVSSGPPRGSLGLSETSPPRNIPDVPSGDPGNEIA
jgi:hypothetical protein